MIFGIGIDIIETDRIKKLIIKDNSFTDKIFTPLEIEYCESRKAGKYQSYAVRFTAKEALFKAIGTGWRDNMSFDEIEVSNDELGKPVIEVKGYVKKYFKKNKIKNIFVSLSHLKKITIAVVVLEL